MVNSSSTTLSSKYNDQVRLLQTVLILISSSHALKDKPLASAFGLCFQLKNKANTEPTVKITALATIRQCCLAVFERVVHEDKVTQGKSISKRSVVENLDEEDDANTSQTGNEQDAIIYQMIPESRLKLVLISIKLFFIWKFPNFLFH